MSVQRFHDAFSLDSARRRFLFKDDFLGDQLQDLWDVTVDAGGSGVVVDAETGGIVRLTTDGDTNDDAQIDWDDIRSLHIDQKICMEVSVKLNSVTAILAQLVLQRDAGNRVLFSTTGGNWTATTTNGADTDTDTGIAADTDEHVFRIETSNTEVLFYIDDVLVATNVTNIPDDAADFLQPRFFIRTTEDVAKSMDLDYVVVSQER